MNTDQTDQPQGEQKKKPLEWCDAFRELGIDINLQHFPIGNVPCYQYLTAQEFIDLSGLTQAFPLKPCTVPAKHEEAMVCGRCGTSAWTTLDSSNICYCHKCLQNHTFVPATEEAPAWFEPCPEWVEYQATDADGAVFGFSSMPNHQFRSVSWANQGRCEKLTTVPPPADWRETLVSRPARGLSPEPMRIGKGTKLPPEPVSNEGPERPMTETAARNVTVLGGSQAGLSPAPLTPSPEPERDAQVAELQAALEAMLNSARPHPMDNPAMFEAWTKGRATLAATSKPQP